MKQVIYSEHHRGIVEYPLMEKPKLENYSATAIGFFDKVINAAGYEKDMKEYNKWLSSPPIAQVRDEDREFFSVPRGKKEYKIEKLHVDADGNPATFYTVGYKLVATPIKEDRNLEPSQVLLGKPVASHSSGFGNNIEQLEEMTEILKSGAYCTGCGHKANQPLGTNKIGIPYSTCCPDNDYVVKLSFVLSLLNNELNVKASVATEADSSNSADNQKNPK